MRGLQDKTTIVPGGASRIGVAVAAAFRSHGSNVVIADIDEAGCRAHEAKGIAFIKADLRADHDIAATVAFAKERYGRIDFLVNVAATYLDNGADSRRLDWLAALDVNLVGSVMLIQAARAELA